MNSTFIAIIMGIVEGLTEFIPVSSTGHLILTGHLLGFEGPKAETFEIFIQLGAILAAAVYYWKRFLSLFQFKMDKLNFLHIIIAMIPASVLGLLFHDQIKSLFNVKMVFYALILGGVLMIVADKMSSRIKTTATNLDELSYLQALKIGAFQCLALWPGFSRSGSTIAGGILSGTDHKTAADFTFIVAVPMMVAASGLDLMDVAGTLNSEDIRMYAVGFAVSFIVALLAIVSFMKLLNKLKLAPFAYYRFAIAIVVWLYLV